ncbi:MAG: hypothetical protein IKN06_13960 [Bacteroidales bacterium]|jgi:VanZ family protein|nr:hypothetical protein [Bacteroidales bacterium]
MTGKQRTFARVLFVLYLVAVAWLCFGKFSSVPDVPRSFWGIPTDKVVHFLMFFPYPILAFFAFDPLTKTVRSTLLWTAATFLTGCAVAGVTEIIQAKYLPYRMGDLADFKADLLALAIASAFVCIIDILKLKRS